MAKNGWKPPKEGENVPDFSSEGPVAHFDKDHANEKMTRIEFELLESYKGMMILMCFFSVIVLIIGKLGKKSIYF